MRTADEARELTDQIRVMANSIFGETSTVGAELDECAKDGYTRLQSGEKVTTSGVSDPTYALVMAPDEASDDRASYLDALRTARKYLGVAETYSGKWRRIAQRRPRQSVVAGLRFECCNMHGCPDSAMAENGRDGRCYTCYRYRKRNGGRDRRGRYDKEQVA